MSDSTDSRRAGAELRSEGDWPAWSMIGSRSLHHYWPSFSPQFRGVLLPPQRRPDGGGVSWSWREAATSDPVSPAELAAVRRRLEKADRELATQAPDPVGGDDAEEDGALTVGNQIVASVNAMVAILVASSDAELAGFVCRSDSVPMVHSWGGSVPARPFYPDALEYSISGAVLMGTESAAGLTVVIENRQGAVLARVQTDGLGFFGFQKIGPGNYRIRVPERGDFPATGFAVTVERQSIVGLELHRGAAVATFAGRASPATPLPASSIVPSLAAVGSPRDPARGRKWHLRSGRVLFPLVAVVVLALVGGWWWTDGRTDDSVAPAESALSWWQSTRERLGIFSHPSSSLPVDPDRALGGAIGAGLPVSLPSATSHAFAQGRTRSLALPPLQRAARPEESAAGKFAVGPAGVRRGLGTVDQESDDETADSDAPTGLGGVADDAPSAPAAAVGNPLGQLGSPSVGGAGRGAGNREEEAEAESSSSRGSLLASAESAEGGAVSPGHFRKTLAAPLNKAMGSVAVASPSYPSRASGAAIDGASPVAASEPASAPAAAEPSVLRPSERSRHAALRPAGVAAGQAPSTPSHRLAAATDDRDDVTEVSADGIATKFARRSRVTVAAARTASTAARGGVRADPTTTDPAASWSSSPELRLGSTTDSPLRQRQRLVVSEFQPRMVQDLILPTQPVRDGVDDGMERARENILRERHTRMPPAFQHTVTTGGFALEFSPEDVGPGVAPRWRDAAGAEVVGPTTHGNRAEASWPNRPPLTKLSLVLIHPDGRELARVNVTPSGGAELLTTAGTRAWYWVGVEIGRNVPASASTKEPDLRLDWRLLSGAPVPATWRRYDRWYGGRGYRLDLPLAPGATGPPACAVTLVDPASGWGIVGEIAQP